MEEPEINSENQQSVDPEKSKNSPSITIKTEAQLTNQDQQKKRRLWEHKRIQQIIQWLHSPHVRKRSQEPSTSGIKRSGIKGLASLDTAVHLGAMVGAAVSGSEGAINQSDVQRAIVMNNVKSITADAQPLDQEYSAGENINSHVSVADRPPEQVMIGPDGKPFAKVSAGKIKPAV